MNSLHFRNFQVKMANKLCHIIVALPKRFVQKLMSLSLVLNAFTCRLDHFNPHSSRRMLSSDRKNDILWPFMFWGNKNKKRIEIFVMVIIRIEEEIMFSGMFFPFKFEKSMRFLRSFFNKNWLHFELNYYKFCIRLQPIPIIFNPIRWTAAFFLSII